MVRQHPGGVPPACEERRAGSQTSSRPPTHCCSVPAVRRMLSAICSDAFNFQLSVSPLVHWLSADSKNVWTRAGWMILGTKKSRALSGSGGNDWVSRARPTTACGVSSHLGRGTVAGWLMGSRDPVRDGSLLLYLGQPQS